MKATKIFLLISIAMGLLSSCSSDDDIKYTAPGKLAGQWWVKYEVETSLGTWEDINGVGYVPFMTYNTAANVATEMFVDDGKEFWDFKVKVDVSASNLTFGSNRVLTNLSYENCDVVVTDGKILLGQGHSKTGVTTDSIHFKITFSDDPDSYTYRVSGHKRTGWDFDEY